MSILDIIKGRFSVRKYLSKAVSDEKLAVVLEAARFSQSAKNLQDWRFIVVRDEPMRHKLVEAAKGQRFVAEAPVIIACCGAGITYQMTCGQYSYSLDVAIAMENMALAAHEAGLGTCWLGAFYEDQVKELLGVPDEDVRIVGLMTVGYAAVEAPSKQRKSVNEIVNYERWE